MKRPLKHLLLFACVALCGFVAGAAVVSYVRRPRPAESPLGRAAEAGDAATIRGLAAAGADVNARERGLTPLMEAARAGRVESVGALLDAGADPNLRDCAVNGWTPLIHALHKHQNAAARALVERGADVNARAGACAADPAEGGMTALMYAAMYDNEEMVKFLLERGADPRAADGKENALTYAVGGASLGRLADIDRAATHPCPVETVRALLASAPDLSIPHSVLNRATFYVVKMKCPEVVRLLEQRGGAPPPMHAQPAGPQTPAGEGARTRTVARN
jgi:hypothetical protein